MHKELEVIAHSCGVAQPRDLSRDHCRIVAQGGGSAPLSELYPPVVRDA